MKKFCLAILLLLVLFTVGCNVEKPTLKLEKESVEIFVDETYEVKPIIEGLKKEGIVKYTIKDETILSIKDGVIKGLKAGQTTVEVTLEGHEVSVVLNIKVVNKQFKVTFIDYDNKVLKEETVEENKAATAPVNPTREGYIFDGWDKEFNNITSDLEVIAKYKAVEYKVVFIDYNKIILKEEFVESGNAATPPNDPSRIGYTFTGWDKEFNNITSDLEINAVYSKTVNKVKFLKDGVLIEELEVEYAAAAVAPANPSKDGYTFKGWDKEFDNVLSDLEVNAIFEINKYEVKFFDSDGTLLEEETVEYLSSATAPTNLVKEGYTFTGWDKEFGSVKENLEIKAIYEINKYEVKFLDFTGELLIEETVEYLQSATAPVAPALENYTFIGWDKEFNNVTSDLIIKAVYEEISNVISVGVGKDYTTITDALSNSIESSEIEVYEGTYTETITIGISSISICAKDNAVVTLNGTITVNKGINNVLISGLIINAEKALVLEGGNSDITFTGNTVEGTAASNGSSSAGNGQIHCNGTVDQLVVTNNKFKQIKGGSYYSSVYTVGVATNVEIKDNYFTNTYLASQNIFGVWLPKVAGYINISNNNFDRLAGNYWTIWVGQSSVGEYTVIDCCDNLFIGGSTSDDYECGISFEKLLHESVYLNVIGNTFKYCKDTVLGIHGSAYSDSTSKANVKVMYNKFLGVDTKMRFGMDPVNFYFGNNYASSAFVDSTTTQTIKSTTAKNDYKSEVELDVAYELYKTSPKDEYSRIVYKLDGGIGSGISRYIEGNEYEIFTPFKEGFNFLGWSLATDSTEYISKISKEMKGDITLYAIWDEIKVSGSNVTYTFNGGVSEELYLINGVASQELTLNNFDNNSGTFWSGGYKNFIYVSTTAGDPLATFSDRIYIGRNKVSGLYEIINILNSGTSSWPAGAEYVITISNSYSDFATPHKVVQQLQIGQVVAFSKKVESISSSTPGKVYFYTAAPTNDTVNAKITAVSKIIEPSKLGYKFLGWFDANDKKYSVLEDFSKDVVVFAKWEALNPVTDIAVENMPTEMVTGDTKQIAASVVPADAYFKDIFYTSSNEDIITVSSTGLLTAINAGSAKITMRDYVNKVNKEFNVVVYSVDSIDAYLDDVCTGALKVNDQIQINAVGFGKNASNMKLVYQTSNASVATVDELGKVTACAVGTANITISCEGNDSIKLVVSVTVCELNTEDKVDALLSLLSDNNFATVEIGNVCLYNDGNDRYYDSMYGSVNRYLFDEYVIDRTNAPTSEANPDNHKSRSGLGGIEFVTVHDTATLTGYGSSIASNMAAGETSIHYVVGDDKIYEVVPEKYIAYHAGDGTGVKFEWLDTGVNAVGNNAPTIDMIKSGTKYYYTVNGITTTIETPISNGERTISNPSSANFANLGPVWTIKNGKYCIGTPWVCFSQVAAGAIVSHGGNNNSIGIEMAVNTRGDIYDTWQRTAKLVADILIRNNLDLTRVHQHNTWSGKNCPQSMIAGDYWESFMQMVALEYTIQKEYKDAKIIIVSNDPTIVDNTGRVINPPLITTTVSYTLTVEIGEAKKSIKLFNIVPGTTTWEQWDGTYDSRTYIWNKGRFAITH